MRPMYRVWGPRTGCEAHVDYTEAILRDVLCRGLYDTEVQMVLLGDKNQDMTSEQMLRFIEAEEAGKRSTSHLLLPQATDALTGSSYKKQEKLSVGGPTPKDQVPAHTVGIEGTEETLQQVRRTECPAFGTKCNHCKRDHHFEKMCRSKDSVRSTRSTEHKNAIFDTLCGVTSVGGAKICTLDHHILSQHTRMIKEAI